MRWIALLLLSAAPAWTNPMLIEDFTDGAAPDWRYVSDRVMGGVSDGAARFVREDDKGFARLEGQVSTANNGGFIQIRRALPDGLPNGAQSVTLTLRGNGARYYVHLRPSDARRPWQYFQASFDTSGVWQEITLPLTAFRPQGGLNGTVRPETLRSIGIVAYGADYSARLDIERVTVQTDPAGS